MISSSVEFVDIDPSFTYRIVGLEKRGIYTSTFRVARLDDPTQLSALKFFKSGA